MDQVTLYEQKLKLAGLSNTKARKTVFSVLLSSNHKPLTMSQLVALCSSIDRASVYRSIESFEHAGIAHKVHHGWKYRLELSEEFHGHHHHITCRICGRSTVLQENTQVETLLMDLGKQVGFSSLKHTLEITGTCKDCSIN